MVEMKTTLIPRTGLVLKNPVIAASGTFGYGTEFASRMDVSGLGAIVCKGTTRWPRAGNEPLRLAETPAGMLNTIGLQNIGVEAVVSRAGSDLGDARRAGAGQREWDIGR